MSMHHILRARPLALLLVFILTATAGPAVVVASTFPQDVFARPAFHLQMGPEQGGAHLPIRNRTAIAIMRQQRTGDDTSHFSAAISMLSKSQDHEAAAEKAALAVSEQDETGAASYGPGSDSLQPLSWVLHRSGPTTVELCAISDFTASPPAAGSIALESALDNSTSSLPRQALIARALQLLEPLKQMCLFHTIDWFTYSFCHGKDVRQFRALTPASAAERANKRAGGGVEGKKAAVKAAAEVAKLRAPVADTSFDAFTLGRWKPANDRINDSADRRQHKATGTSTSQSTASRTSRNAVTTAIGTPGGFGTELIEVVQFGDWDEEELHAEEAQILSRLSSSSSSSSQTSSGGLQGPSPNRQRYISQTWSDGTLCDINHLPRTVEVQFHCGNRKGLGDQIVAIKETTICNYVLIVETNRLCSEPAFAGGGRDVAHPIRCHRIVRDDWPGTAIGDLRSEDPQANRGAAPDTGGKVSGESTVSGISADDAAAAAAEKQLHPTSDRAQARAETRDTDDEGDKSSHTFGDLSRYSSVHDDFYDEALGGDGYLDEELDDLELGQPQIAHRDIYGADGFDDDDEIVEESEMFFRIGLDEDGKLSVDVLNEEEAEWERAAALLEDDEEDDGGAAGSGQEAPRGSDAGAAAGQ